MFSFPFPQVRYGLVAIIAHANIIFLANNKYFAGMVVVAISTEVSVFSVAVFCPGEGCQCIFFINHSLHLPQFCELSPPPHPSQGNFSPSFSIKSSCVKSIKGNFADPDPTIMTQRFVFLLRFSMIVFSSFKFLTLFLLFKYWRIEIHILVSKSVHFYSNQDTNLFNSCIHNAL